MASAGAGIRFEVRAGVEAEPADPKDRGADHGERHRVRSHVVLAVAGARTDDQRAHKGRDTGVEVDDGSSGEIQRTEAEQQAVRIPHHVGNREIDEGHPERHEQDHRRELHTLGEGADDQRRRDAGEGHLEGDVDIFRQDHALREGGDRGVLMDPHQEDLAEAAPERTGAAAEGEGIAPEHPDHHHKRSDGRALHEHGEHVLGAHQAAIEQGQPRQEHEQHQRAGHQHPGGVAFVHHRSRGHRSRRRGFLGEGRKSAQRAERKCDCQ